MAVQWAARSAEVKVVRWVVAWAALWVVLSVDERAVLSADERAVLSVANSVGARAAEKGLRLAAR